MRTCISPQVPDITGAGCTPRHFAGFLETSRELWFGTIARMTCAVFDALFKEWEAALREDTRALYPGELAVRRMSSSKLVNWRKDARSALQRIESELNSHIAGCATCQREGREPKSG